jgi:hypothetical protein
MGSGISNGTWDIDMVICHIDMVILDIDMGYGLMIRAIDMVILHVDIAVARYVMGCH